MTEKEVTPPPAIAAASTSSPLTPNPKRARMSSPDGAVQTTEEQPQTTESAAALEPAAAVVTSELLTENNELEADDGASDSGFGADTDDGTSISSSIYAGYMENGRRYQTKREGEYWGPADEKQFLSMQAAHIVYRILDSREKNPLFRSPIPDTAQNILDIGTGNGIWATEVADLYPSALVQGIDLFPPPQDWVPPNCRFEVDDALKPWEFKEKFDLVHLRDMQAAFSNEQWRLLYKQAYNNILPGGWIEDVEPGIFLCSDDGTIVPGGILENWGPLFVPMFEKMGKPVDTVDTVRARIEAAGFTNIHEKLYKVPIGDWAKNPRLKEAGKFCKSQMLEGMEGYVLFVMTNFAEPAWTPEEVQVYLAKVREELSDPKLHCYVLKRRVWAQKPYDTEPKVEKEVEVNTVA